MAHLPSCLRLAISIASAQLALQSCRRCLYFETQAYLKTVQDKTAQTDSHRRSNQTMSISILLSLPHTLKKISSSIEIFKLRKIYINVV